MQKRFLLRRVGAVLGILLVIAVIALAGYALLRAIQDARAEQIEGLHEVRSKRLVADAREALGGSVEFFYVIYVNPECGACVKYMPNVIEVYETMSRSDYGYQFGIVLIVLGDHSDKEVQAWLKEHDIPLGIPVLTGATPEQFGLPDAEVDQGAEMDPSAVPATFLYYDGEEGELRTMGYRDGLITVQFLMRIPNLYFDWKSNQ